MRTLLLTITVAGFVVIGAASAAQNRPAASPTASNQAIVFEAASVKANSSSGTGSFVGRRPGGRFGAENASLRELIQFAYQIQSYVLVGGPSWVDSDRWDVVAKLDHVPPPAPPGQADETILALRALLADRYALVLRRETRQLPIYALVLARADGRLGPQISRSAVDCEALMAAMNNGNRPPAPPVASDGRPLCDVRGRVGSIQAGGFPLSELATALSTRVQRPVADRTGLTGPWDLTLTYSPDVAPVPPAAATLSSSPTPIDSNGASLFTALQEQLGLKLESTRGAVEVLVIERSERPMDN